MTAASLFDGHDAAINIMRRIIPDHSGVEVMHLGHDRSVEGSGGVPFKEDTQAIAMTGYQGGHSLSISSTCSTCTEGEEGAGHIKIFGGGGGTILPSEMEELPGYGITRLYGG